MSFYVTIREIRAATKLGVLATRWMLRLPYPLPFVAAPALVQGGKPQNLYMWADIAPRLRLLKPSREITEEMIDALMRMARTRFKGIHHE